MCCIASKAKRGDVKREREGERRLLGNVRQTKEGKRRIGGRGEMNELGFQGW